MAALSNLDKDFLAFVAALASVLAAALGVLAILLIVRVQATGSAGRRAEADAVRAHVTDAERALTRCAEQARLEQHAAASGLTDALVRGQAEARVQMEAKLREMAEQSAARLDQIERAVHEQLHVAVERQMQGSFQRVIDQFAQVQKAMGDVQAVTAQVGDLRRIFSNVKARGGWGETQLRALLEDCLPGGFETNRRIRDDTFVEFAVVMPVRGDVRPVLAIDAKFPTEDYERLLQAAELNDAEGERVARAGLARRLRAEAKKIGERYVHPPTTVEFAVLYLPTDGLYVEAARMPGLIEAVGREERVLIVGPSLAPALLRTIQLGFVTLGLEQKVDHVRDLLSATRGEMVRMDALLERLGRKATEFGSVIDAARTRTRVMQRTLRGIETVDAPERLGLTPEMSKGEM